MGKRLVVGVKLAPKLVYSVGDPRYHPRQYISDGYQLGESALLKHYLNGDLGVCLKIRCRFSQGNTEEFYAVFSHLDAAWNSHAGELDGPPVNVETWVDIDRVHQQR